MTGCSYEMFKVLVEHCLDPNRLIESYGIILQCAVEADNVDWVRFCLEHHASPVSLESFSRHFILAIAAAFASNKISGLLIKWGSDIKGSSALNIASHKGKADLVKLLLQKGADVNEKGVSSIDKDPKDLEGTALQLVKKGRKDILQILLDHGAADVNQKDSMDKPGKTVILKIEANGDSIVGRNGGF